MFFAINNPTERRSEEQVLRMLACCYGPHEIEHRVKSISVTANFANAKDYCLRFERYSGGVVLGFEPDKLSSSSLPENWEQERTIYILRRASIETGAFHSCIHEWFS
jgi:hypothetical protein